MTAIIDDNGNVTSITKKIVEGVTITLDCPFYYNWSQAQFYKYENGNWVEQQMAEFSISKVDYDWGSQKATISLSNGDILTFDCNTTWSEIDCVNAVKSTARYKQAINI